MSTIIDNAALPGPPKPSRHSELLDRPDQQSVRDDLMTFFGPHAQVYLDVYDKMRIEAPGLHTATWSWPVFFGSFTWFFYRKMYLLGAMLIFMPLLLAYLFGSAGGALSIVFAMWGKSWYVNCALRRIAKANQLGLTEAHRADYLRRAGGVSWPAGIFGGLIYGFFVVTVIVGAYARHKARHG